MATSRAVFFSALVQATCRNSTQLPSGSSTMPIFTPGRISVSSLSVIFCKKSLLGLTDTNCLGIQKLRRIARRALAEDRTGQRAQGENDCYPRHVPRADDVDRHRSGCRAH